MRLGWGLGWGLGSGPSLTLLELPRRLEREFALPTSSCSDLDDAVWPPGPDESGDSLPPLSFAWNLRKARTTHSGSMCGSLVNKRKRLGLGFGFGFRLGLGLGLGLGLRLPC